MSEAGEADQGYNEGERAREFCLVVAVLPGVSRGGHELVGVLLVVIAATVTGLRSLGERSVRFWAARAHHLGYESVSEHRRSRYVVDHCPRFEMTWKSEPVTTLARLLREAAFLGLNET